MGGTQRNVMTVPVRRKRKSTTVPSLKEASALREHKLLTTCESGSPNNPGVGCLVYAKNYGSVYWPAFLVDPVTVQKKLEVDEDEDDSVDFAFLTYFEQTFRASCVPWIRVIKVDVSCVQAQFDLIVRLNSFEGKKSCHNNLLLNKSFKLMLEFVSVEALNRTTKADVLRGEYKKSKHLSLMEKRLGTKSNKEKKAEKESPEWSESQQEELEQADEVVALMVARTSEIYSLRSAIKLDVNLISASGTDKFEEKEEETEKEVQPKGKRKSSNFRKTRPMEGKPLKVWVKDMFELLDKRFLFQQNLNLRCSSCKEIISPVDLVYCHDFPYHKTCLTEIEGLANGIFKIIYKCIDCIDERCFICKSNANSLMIAKCNKCDLRFHRDCLDTWPQADIMGSTGPITCPLHFCHTCKAEQRLSNKMRNYRVSNRTAFRCLYCLTAYHKGSCLPAGVGGSVMANQYLICPRHNGKDTQLRKKNQRILGCFPCSKKLKRTSVIMECKSCPLMYHPQCCGYDSESGISLEQYGATFKCDTCRWGYFPMYGQVVWYKQPGSVYWPALISFPPACTRQDVISLSSVMYCGTRGQNFNNAKIYDSLPFSIGSKDILNKLGVLNDKPQLVTAFEEGKYLYELAEAYRESILPKAEPVYKKVERNVYRTVIDGKPKSKKFKKKESEACQCGSKNENEPCSPSSNCYNRELRIECNTKNCTGGDNCHNRMFTEKKFNIDNQIETFVTTTSKGWGVRTTVSIAKDIFIIEYVGEIITKEEMDWRLARKFDTGPLYFLQIDKSTYIDAEYCGNYSRLINHSCSPNCHNELYTSATGKQVAGIFALRDIEVGEELTFDYNYGKNSAIGLRCQCGVKDCKRYIGDRHRLNNQLIKDGIVNPNRVQDDWVEWDEECTVCKTGGEVLMCEYDNCSKVSHPCCIGLKKVPKTKWICADHPPLSPPKLMSNVTQQHKLSIKSKLNGLVSIKKSLRSKSEGPPSFEKKVGRTKSENLASEKKVTRTKAEGPSTISKKVVDKSASKKSLEHTLAEASTSRIKTSDLAKALKTPSMTPESFESVTNFTQPKLKRPSMDGTGGSKAKVKKMVCVETKTSEAKLRKKKSEANPKETSVKAQIEKTQENVAKKLHPSIGPAMQAIVRITRLSRDLQLRAEDGCESDSPKSIMSVIGRWKSRFNEQKSPPVHHEII